MVAFRKKKKRQETGWERSRAIRKGSAIRNRWTKRFAFALAILFTLSAALPAAVQAQTNIPFLKSVLKQKGNSQNTQSSAQQSPSPRQAATPKKNMFTKVRRLWSSDGKALPKRAPKPRVKSGLGDIFRYLPTRSNSTDRPSPVAGTMSDSRKSAHSPGNIPAPHRQTQIVPANISIDTSHLHSQQSRRSPASKTTPLHTNNSQPSTKQSATAETIRNLERVAPDYSGKRRSISPGNPANNPTSNIENALEETETRLEASPANQTERREISSRRVPMLQQPAHVVPMGISTSQQESGSHSQANKTSLRISLDTQPLNTQPKTVVPRSKHQKPNIHDPVKIAPVKLNPRPMPLPAGRPPRAFWLKMLEEYQNAPVYTSRQDPAPKNRSVKRHQLQFTNSADQGDSLWHQKYQEFLDAPFVEYSPRQLDIFLPLKASEHSAIANRGQRKNMATNVATGLAQPAPSDSFSAIVVEAEDQSLSIPAPSKKVEYQIQVVATERKDTSRRANSNRPFRQMPDKKTDTTSFASYNASLNRQIDQAPEVESVQQEVTDAIQDVEENVLEPYEGVPAISNKLTGIQDIALARAAPPKDHPRTVPLPTDQQYAASRYTPAGRDDGAGFAFYWEAPGSWHKPLYFEEINLERFGYGHGGKHGFLQSAISGAHFFTSVMILPYNIGVHHPSEHIYTLGHYRPGSCVPWQKHRLPLSAKGILLQGMTVSGLILAIP